MLKIKVLYNNLIDNTDLIITRPANQDESLEADIDNRSSDNCGIASLNLEKKIKKLIVNRNLKNR